MTFPPLDPNTNDIGIIFSTIKSNSLMVYNYGEQTGGRSDFVAVELVDGKPVFSFGGAQTAMTRVTVNKYVANGRYHRIIATRNNRVASLSVEDCTESGEACKTCQAGDDKCFAKDVGDVGTLNFKNHDMFFGGINEVQPIITRPEQVRTDDFVGCIKSLSINGQQLNLKTVQNSSGIQSSCPIPGDICDSHNCGGGTCREVNWRPVCECPGGVQADDCDKSFQPIALDTNATVNFKISHKHKRIQLLASRKLDKISSTLKENEVSFSFRSEDEDGQLVTAENTNGNEYTVVYIEKNQLVFETKKSGHQSINMISKAKVTDGDWHVLRLKQAQQVLKVYLDDVQMGDDLESSSTHDFLDPYLSNIVFGGRRGQAKAFRGCMVNFTINNDVQSFLGHSGLLPNVTHHGHVMNDCAPDFLSITAGNTPVNIGVIIVVIFFIILIVAILASFFAFRIKKKRYKKMQQNATDNSQPTQNIPYSNKKIHDTSRMNQLTSTPQKPDIVDRADRGERQITNESYDDLPEYSASMVMQEPGAMEHYDLENASSIAPSDIDIIYHYKGFRDGGGHHGRDRWGKPNNKIGNSPIRLNNLSSNKMHNTPLARLSPSSELSHQTPRILTLKDISGKTVQSALDSCNQQGRQSQRSTRMSPMGHLSDSSGSDLNSSTRNRRRKKKKQHGLTANSSLASTVDGVSMNSGSRKKSGFSDRIETPAEMFHDDNSSSDSPSDNDSFTCSEYEYDAPYNPGNSRLDTSTPAGGMVFRKLDNLRESQRLITDKVEGRGSLTSCNPSDDELTGYASPTGPASWERLLNWSPNFHSFAGVFNDIGELPDNMETQVRQSPIGDRDEEEYI